MITEFLLPSRGDMPEVNNIPPSLSYRPADPAEPVLDISIGDALRAATSTWRTRTALIDGTSEEQTRRRWTFEELLTETEKVARALLLRFVSGEHVAIWAANGPQWVMIELGAALAGLTLVTVKPCVYRRRARIRPKTIAGARHYRSGCLQEPESCAGSQCCP
jgi:hypothetical protein